MKPTTWRSCRFWRTIRVILAFLICIGIGFGLCYWHFDIGSMKSEEKGVGKEVGQEVVPPPVITDPMAWLESRLVEVQNGMRRLSNEKEPLDHKRSILENSVKAAEADGVTEDDLEIKRLNRQLAPVRAVCSRMDQWLSELQDKEGNILLLLDELRAGAQLDQYPELKELMNQLNAFFELHHEGIAQGDWERELGKP